MRAALGIRGLGLRRRSPSASPLLLRAPLWELVGEHRHVIYFLDGEVAAVPIGLPDRWVFAFPAPGPADLRAAIRQAGGRRRRRSPIEHVSTTTYAVELAERFRERSAFLDRRRRPSR